MWILFNLVCTNCHTDAVCFERGLISMYYLWVPWTGSDCEIYCHEYKNNLGNIYFIISLPPPGPLRGQYVEYYGYLHAAETEVMKRIPVYHSRAQRKDFYERFSRVIKWTPLQARYIYLTLTGDMSSMSSKMWLARNIEVCFSDIICASCILWHRHWLFWCRNSRSRQTRVSHARAEPFDGLAGRKRTKRPNEISRVLE